MVVHRGRPGPVDLIVRRDSAGQGPCVGVDDGGIDGRIDILRLGKVQLPLGVIKNQPSNTIGRR